MTHLLHIDSSARINGSVTRQLTAAAVEHFNADQVTTRDLFEGLPFVSQDWIDANFTDVAERSAQQEAALSLSTILIDELKAADIVVVGVPIYNFGVPAALKAWVDQICRARETFRYTENGPKGLLSDKRVIILAASGGVTVGSEFDFATTYMRHVMRFVGLTDVTVIAADRLNTGNADEIVAAALSEIKSLPA